MFSWLGAHDRGKKDPEVFQTVTDGLKKLYKSKLLPLEEHYRFHEFHSPALDNADFDNKPMLLLVGQYSTGKTTFIRTFHEKYEWEEYKELVLDFLKELEEEKGTFEWKFVIIWYNKGGLTQIWFRQESE